MPSSCVASHRVRLEVKAILELTSLSFIDRPNITEIRLREKVKCTKQTLNPYEHGQGVALSFFMYSVVFIYILGFGARIVRYRGFFSISAFSLLSCPVLLILQLAS